MSSKKNKKEATDYSVYDKNITDIDTEEYTREITVKYGVNVSVFRACSSLLDGLTPGQRRRLYVFYKFKGATPDKPRKKVDDLLGPVTGFHPHGGMSIDNSFINDIKEWESHELLYDVQGNTGSVSGQRAAATRYLEARLSVYAYKCFFEEYDESVMEMVESNTRVDKEPVTIPSRYPHCFIASTTGIGWGHAISIPPYNPTELFELTKRLIKNPKMKNVYLYPDSPRGYDIIENDNIIDICDKGIGTLKIQARMDYHEEDGVRYIDVYGFPDKTTMDSIIQKITTLVKSKVITGIEDLANRTHLRDVRFHIILNKSADPKFIMDMLYKKTRLRTHLSLNFNFAGRTEMQPLGLKDALLVWIDNRIDIKQRIYIKKLARTKERIHTVEGILTMLDPKNVDKTIDIIKTSSTDEESINKLMNHYGVTSYQANVVNNTKLSKIKKTSRQEYSDELDKLNKEANDLVDIVTDRERIKQIMIAELDEGIKLFGKPRACRIISPDALEPPKHTFNIILTKKYVKKVSVNCTTIGYLDSDDEVVSLFSNVAEDKQIFILDNLGKIYRLPLNRMIICDAATKGQDLLELVGLKGSVVTAFVDNGNLEAIENTTMIMFMKSGIVKRTNLNQYISTRTILQGVLLNKGDELCHAIIYDPNFNDAKSGFALIYTDSGLGISLELDSITITDRVTKGSKYLALEGSDKIQGVCTGVSTNNKVFVLTTKGKGKICMLDDIFRTSKRRADMIRLTGLEDGDSVFTIIPIEDKDTRKVTCILQSGEKVDINLSDVKTTTRLSKGFKLVPVKRGDAIIKVKLS